MTDPRRDWRPARDPAALRASVVAQAALLLGHHRRRVASGSATPEDEFLLRTMLKDRLLWSWTTAVGGAAHTKFAKLIPQPFWSTVALQSYAARGNAAMRGRESWSLVHEHVVPRAIITDALLALTEPIEATVRELLERLGVACVVTVAEDRLLAATECDPAAPWARYQAAGIAVINLRA